MIAEPASQIALPGEIESPRAKLVYLFLSMNETVTITELQNSLDMKKISLYSVLKCLEEQNLISKNGESYALA